MASSEDELLRLFSCRSFCKETKPPISGALWGRGGQSRASSEVRSQLHPEPLHLGEVGSYRSSLSQPARATVTENHTSFLIVPEAARPRSRCRPHTMTSFNPNPSPKQCLQIVSLDLPNMEIREAHFHPQHPLWLSVLFCTTGKPLFPGQGPGGTSREKQSQPGLATGHHHFRSPRPQGQPCELHTHWLPSHPPLTLGAHEPQSLSPPSSLTCSSS